MYDTLRIEVFMNKEYTNKPSRIEVFMNKKYTNKPSMTQRFKEELMALIEKHYKDTWKRISYEWINTKGKL